MKLFGDTYLGTQSCSGGSVVKNPAAKPRDAGLISELGRSPREGNSIPLQYSCLGNPMDRGSWQVTVYRIAKELAMTW